MGDRRSLLAALALSLAAAGAAQLPYLAAGGLASEGKVFAGFLINPIDGFSYLAKMRQGAEGSWLFHLPYAAEPGPGALVYVYYVALGHVAGGLGLPLLSVYVAARFVTAFLMFMTGWAFLRAVLGAAGPIWPAFLLTLLGTGLGWLAIAFDLVTPDLWMPEAIPLLSAYNNAHFPLATAGLLAAAIAVVGGGLRARKRLAVAAAAGVVVGAVLPFVFLSLAAVLFLWLVWEKARGEAIHERGIPFVGFAAGAAPWLAYDAWLSMAHPAIAGWTAQNQTPSPPPYEFAIGYGLILLLAIVGAFRSRPQASPAGRLLLVWVVVNSFLLYAPFGLQRRLSLGLFFPLAALAALGLRTLGLRPRAERAVLAAVLILSVPSHLVVMASGLSGVRRGEPALVMTSGEAQAYQWAGEHLEPGALVLAGPTAGNRLPAFADVRVLYGHPFETPGAEAQLDRVERLYSDQDLASLQDLGVSYVFYGPEERNLGAPGYLEELEPLFDADGVLIYGVEEP